MVYNPFENREIDLKISEACTPDKDWGYGALVKEEFRDKIEISYTAMLRAINFNIDWFIQKYTGQYQGDIVNVGKSKVKYYYAAIGYGSCSCCDCLEAAEDLKGKECLEALQGIQDSIKSSIKEFDDLQSLIDYIKKDYSGMWSYDKDDMKEIVKELKDLLEK